MEQLFECVQPRRRYLPPGYRHAQGMLVSHQPIPLRLSPTPLAIIRHLRLQT